MAYFTITGLMKKFIFTLTAIFILALVSCEASDSDIVITRQRTEKVKSIQEIIDSIPKYESRYKENTQSKILRTLTGQAGLKEAKETEAGRASQSLWKSLPRSNISASKTDSETWLIIGQTTVQKKLKSFLTMMRKIPRNTLSLTRLSLST